MLKSCNSDCHKFVVLTNENIVAYLDTIPRTVEEITFWNYQMCLRPNEITYKEVLFIPSLERFPFLKCVKFYNERIEIQFTSFPVNVERVFFISCVMQNKWYNVCVYRKNLKYIDQYHSSFARIKNILCLLQPLHPVGNTRSTLPPMAFSLPPPPRRKRSICNKMLEGLGGAFLGAFGCVFVRQTRVSPERLPDESDGIEMSEFVPFCKMRRNNQLQLLYMSHHHHNREPNISLESIQRLKKIYDLLVNENIIQFLIGD
jgi:hypothetical protein